MTVPGSGEGSYVLVLRCDSSIKIAVGALGLLTFNKGYYLYVGSAFGPGGLKARLKHHLGQSKNPHWHIDYLRKECEMVEIWWCENPLRLEDRWVRLLEQLGYRSPHAGFGSSDSRSYSHLFHSEQEPPFALFERQMADGWVSCWRLAEIP